MVSCIICYRTYNSTIVLPKVLQCGHDACLVCLGNLFRKNNEKGIVCPSCREIHPGSPENIATCYAILRTVSSSELHASQSYEKCGELLCLNKATITCNDCPLFLCLEHKHSHICIGVQEIEIEGDDLKSSNSFSAFELKEFNKIEVNTRLSLSTSNDYSSNICNTSTNTNSFTDQLSKKSLTSENSMCLKDVFQCEKIGCCEDAVDNVSYKSCRRLCPRHFQEDLTQVISYSNKILVKASNFNNSLNSHISELTGEEQEYSHKLQQLFEIKRLIENKLDDAIVRFQESQMALDLAHQNQIRQKKHLCSLMRKLKTNLRKHDDDYQEIWEMSNKLKHYLEDLENQSPEKITVYNFNLDIENVKTELCELTNKIRIKKSEYCISEVSAKEKTKNKNCSNAEVSCKFEKSQSVSDVIELHRQPWDVTICSNTHGYTVYKDRISRNASGTNLPETIIIVKAFGE